MEDNVVMVEGRLSIREDEGNVTILANKIQDFNDALSSNVVTNKSVFEIDITNTTDEQKNRLRGAIKFFNGDRNNTPILIINGDRRDLAGGIFANDEIKKEILDIVKLS